MPNENHSPNDQWDGAKFEAMLRDFPNWVYICDAGQFHNMKDGAFLNENGFVSLYQQCFPDYNMPKRFRKGEDFKYDLNQEPDQSHVIPIVKSASFRPGQPKMPQDNSVNLWNPPIKGRKGNIDLFLEHMIRLFPNEEDLGNVMDFLYYTIAKPEVKIQFALLIIGEQGTGKSIVFDALMRRILGKSMVSKVEMKELESDFDRWKRGKKLVTFSEFSTRFKASAYRRVKEVITDETLSCTIKGKDAIEMENYLNIIAFSNDSAPIKLEKNDRRWLIVKSPATDHEDSQERSEYFKALWSLVNSNPEFIAHFFQEEYEPMGLDPHGVAPMTEAKAELLDASVGSLDKALESFMDLCDKEGHTIFTHDEFVDYVKHSPRHDDCAQFAKSPNAFMEVVDKYQLWKLGRQTNAGKYTTKNLYGLPLENFAGVGKVEAARIYEDQRRGNARPSLLKSRMRQANIKGVA